MSRKRISLISSGAMITLRRALMNQKMKKLLLCGMLPAEKWQYCILVNMIWLLAFVPYRAFGQNDHDKQAFDILDKAMSSLDPEGGSMAIYFEGIALSASHPRDIFTMSAFKVYRGGFFISEGKKFEMQLGVLKALSDGKLMVIIDEVSKTMVVDSVREKMLEGVEEEMPDIEKLLDENFGNMELKYSGKETVNGKVCHKIKGELKEDPSKHVYYYVEEATNRLLLIGEWQGEAYDVYWIRKIGKAPGNHQYQVNLPSRELTSFYGYEVVDMRYTLVRPADED